MDAVSAFVLSIYSIAIENRHLHDKQETRKQQQQQQQKQLQNV
jgi:hypothetical protein